MGGEGRRDDGDYVLNAFRHLMKDHNVSARLRPREHKCSTPFGI